MSGRAASATVWAVGAANGLDKVVRSLRAAVADVTDGQTIMVGGFGNSGVPVGLLDALAERDVRDLTIISNNCGTGEVGLSKLFKRGMVKKVLASFPSQRGNHHFLARHEAGEVEVEIVPQGTLVERIRAAGAGIGGFYTRTGVGTEVARRKECRELDGHTYVLELPLRADVALIKAHRGDPYGNLRYRFASRNLNPVMAKAATITIAEVEQVVAVGDLGPDDVHTPGIFVQRVVQGDGRIA